MRLRKPLNTTILFTAIFIVGMLVLYFMTRNILNSSSTAVKTHIATERPVAV